MIETKATKRHEQKQFSLCIARIRFTARQPIRIDFTRTLWSVDSRKQHPRCLTESRSTQRNREGIDYDSTVGHYAALYEHYAALYDSPKRRRSMRGFGRLHILLLIVFPVPPSPPAAFLYGIIADAFQLIPSRVDFLDEGLSELKDLSGDPVGLRT